MGCPVSCPVSCPVVVLYLSCTTGQYRKPHPLPAQPGLPGPARSALTYPCPVQPAPYPCLAARPIWEATSPSRPACTAPPCPIPIMANPAPYPRLAVRPTSATRQALSPTPAYPVYIDTGAYMQRSPAHNAANHASSAALLRRCSLQSLAWDRWEYNVGTHAASHARASSIRGPNVGLYTTRPLHKTLYVKQLIL